MKDGENKVGELHFSHIYREREYKTGVYRLRHSRDIGGGNCTARGRRRTDYTIHSIVRKNIYSAVQSHSHI